MIAKRIDRKTNDSFKRLAEYIAAAKDKGEKLDQFWMVNCNAGGGIEDLDVGIIEVEATQALNRRAMGDRSYHLIVSFRDEKPAPEALVEIERAFAEALGFGEHQRMVATHQNTGNFHMHLAINKVHPVTLRNVTPKRDFQILEKTCREIEKRFGLKVDLGRENKPEKDRINWKAKDYEAHTWQESLQTYVTREKADLAKVLSEAKSWQEVHLAMAERGLVLKPRGAGMVIATIEGDQAVKASSLGREWSAANLKKRLGPYRPPENAHDGARDHGSTLGDQNLKPGASTLSAGRKAYTR
jgi:LmbE family N-acetylglucosaminyl deacetylase